MSVLRYVFPGRLISRFGYVPRPNRSADLSACDFTDGCGVIFKEERKITNYLQGQRNTSPSLYYVV